MTLGLTAIGTWLPDARIANLDLLRAVAILLVLADNVVGAGVVGEAIENFQVQFVELFLLHCYTP